jgi:hypothetical protein
MELNDIRRAFREGSSDEIIKLVDNQPELVKQVFIDGTFRITLLSLAVGNNDSRLVKSLLKQGAGAVVTDSLISTWLMSANSGKKPNKVILECLLKHGAKFPIEDERTCSIFTRHTMENVYRHELIDTLNSMMKLGFDPVATENIGQASMIAKSLENHYEGPTTIAEVLLSCGCSTDALKNDYSTPLGNALEMGLYAFAEKLLDKGANPTKLKNLPHKLAQYQNVPVELLNRLLKNRKLDDITTHGSTPIHEAIEYNNIKYVNHLIENGVDINLESKLGAPLIYAIKCNKKNMVKHLIKLGTDINAISKTQETALDIALTQASFKQVCDAMVKAGAKTSVELSGGQDDLSGILTSINKAIQAGEAWANAARTMFTSVDICEASYWNTLIRHCLDNNTAKPSKKWMKEADQLIEGIGDQLVRDCLLEWLPLVKNKRVESLSVDEDDYYGEYYGSTDHVISENNTRLLKGLIWVSSRYNDNAMSRTLRDLASQMYKKVYGIGMRNAKLGNAALYSLSVMSGTTGLKEIIVLRAATKYNPALVNINRVFDKLAEASGQTADELAELSIPDYGLTGIGEFRQKLGKFEAIATLVSVGKCELFWSHKDKVQKSVPAAIKSDYADDIKSIKGLIKDVQVGCSAHSLRLEQMYLRRKTLDYNTWKEQYVEHKLIGFLSQRLIWRVTSQGTSFDVFYSENGYVTHEGMIANIPSDAIIQLWHPSMSAPNEVLAWRTYLIEKELTQPFKQAHREIYLLTDAERITKDHSLRFAHHILKHSQFHALATQRGWTQLRGGSWDGGSENSAYKHLPAFNMNVCFEAEGAESYDFSDTGIYECVATGDVCFSSSERVSLENIDPLLFSEVMRDVDLFVGVTSIANDPNWRDRENEYWSSSSFGDLSETANTRKEVLSALIPKLKIADQLRIDGKFLCVAGKLTTYKIHLGSSNILMAPNDSYLCIVEVKSKASVMLPFEGDHTLSLILSKAMMLADDTKIKDETILSQINMVTG